MNKKILSIFLTALMLISSTVAVTAAKKNYEDETEVDNNIYATWGNFEAEGPYTRLNQREMPGGIVEGGANGTEHCWMVDSRGYGNREFRLDRCGLIPGETYDISFYYKTDTPNVPSITLIHVMGNGDAYGFPGTRTMSTEWTKYEATYTCKGTVNERGELSAGGSLWFRFGDASSSYDCVAYVDEIEIRPRGLVEWDYERESTGYDLPDDITEYKEYDGAVLPEKVTFSDVTNHWSKETVESLATYNYIEGMGDGTYAPDDKVTRAQFIKMMVAYYGMISPEYKGEYKDIKGDEWYVEYVTLARQLGLISPEFYKDGNFYPDKPITREEAATIAAAIAKQHEAKTVEGAVTSFTDEGSVSAWARNGVKAAASYGLIKGYDTGDYKPTANITRAEAAAILFRIVELNSKFNIFVDAQNGNDANDGSEAAPLKTMEAARDMAKACSDTMRNDITINMRGRFRLEDTFTLDASHSGKNGYNIIYTSWGEEKAVVTMADEYSDWEMHDPEKNIYKTYVGEGTIARQAWFNDVRGTRARNLGYLENSVQVDKTYFLCDNFELLDFAHPEELELVFNIFWINPRIQVKAIYEENGRVRIDLNDYWVQNDSRIKNDGDGTLSRQQASYIENAYELLDDQGEYYVDKRDGYMYYIPRIGEDMNNMTVKIAKGEQLLKVDGTADAFVKNVTFDRLNFEGTAWNFVDRNGGFFDGQNNHENVSTFAGKIYKAPGSAIQVSFVENVNLTNSVVRQVGMLGVLYDYGAKHSNIVGNEIYDAAGGGLYLDAVTYKSYLDYRPRADWTEYMNVSNNYIHDVAWDYEDGVGITLGYPRHTTVYHNEISNVPYSGFHVGYDWESYNDYGSLTYHLYVCYNYVHDVMKARVSDGAAFYSLGGTSHEGNPTDKNDMNRIWNNYFSRGWQCDYVYPDQGSSSWYVKNNVADSRLVQEIEYNFDRKISKPSYWMHMHTSSIKWIVTEENWAMQDYAYAAGMMNQKESEIEPVNIYPDGNFPPEAQAVMAAAGIEDEYKDNFDLDAPKVFVARDRWRNLSIGKAEDANFLVLGGKDEQFDIRDFYIDFQCEDDAVTYDQETNTITAHKVGIYEADAVAVINGTLQRQHLLMECGDDIETLDFGGDTILLMNGFKKELEPTANTIFGNTYTVAESDWTHDLVVADTSVAVLEGKTLTAVGNGSTRVHGTVYVKGVPFKFNMELKVVSHGSKEAESLPYEVFNLGEQGQWKLGSIKKEDGGIQVLGSPNHTVNSIPAGLYAFDMVVEPGSSWPTIAFCDNDWMGTYATNDCYMFGFKQDHIEFQRWNKGVRTMIFGNSENPIVGPGVSITEDNKFFEYGKRHSIVMGALKADNGTRLVLTIDGQNIIDYLDTGAKALKPSGYYVVYNPAPGMTFYPFTDIKSGK